MAFKTNMLVVDPQQPPPNILVAPSRADRLSVLTLSIAALSIVGVAIALVLGSYVFGLTQPVRWPSLIYFSVALLATLFSKRWALFFIIASLPLIPELHIQLQHLKPPAVKYFIAYPGVDVIAGYFVAISIEKIFTSNDKKFSLPDVPWPLSLVLIMTAVSVGVSIARGLSRSDADFSVRALVTNSFQFKLMDRFNDYYPIADLVVHSFGVLLIVLLIPLLKNSTNRDELIFKPICVGLGISAIWGLFQAFTSFGLPITTSQYRIDSFGFGAHGFQPDLHAFAAHMLLGAVGLYGYIGIAKKSHLGKFVLGTLCVLCWIALVLSKSRASLLLAIFYSVLLLFGFFVKRGGRENPLTLLLMCLAVVFILYFTFSQTSHWLKELYSALFQSEDRSFEFLNEISKFRLEFYTAAVRMWSEFPLFGLGQGSFFKLSAIQDFSGSALMVSSKGENAHNYFLQTLAEVGLIGFVCYAMIFVLPLRAWSDNKNQILPVSIALGSMLLGNVYSHAFLIRENLFLFSVLIALSYAHLQNDRCEGLIRITSLGRVFIAITTAILLLYGVTEVANSFNKAPFTLKP